MTAARRRDEILQALAGASGPVSAAALAACLGVSRQVVVQDIALLRTEGYPIVSTAKGYLLNEPKCATRVLKVCHTNEQVEEELTTIVDLGGTVLNVMVNHRVYGRVEAALNMLDNMTPEQMAEAIRVIDGRAETECSGNITKENIKTITSLGVDYVSSGALTHSAPILDISLKHLRVLEG